MKTVENFDCDEKGSNVVKSIIREDFDLNKLFDHKYDLLISISIIVFKMIFSLACKCNVMLDGYTIISYDLMQK